VVSYSGRYRTRLQRWKPLSGL